MAANTTCCSCNGLNARCITCICVKGKKPRVNCHPSKSNKCQNNITHRQMRLVSISSSGSAIVGSSSVLDRSPTCSASTEIEANLPSSTLQPNVQGIDSQAGNATYMYVDPLMVRAYGESLVQESQSIDPPPDVWYSRWLTIVQLSGKHYSLPGGPVGRKYVNQLSKELSYFTAGTYSSERFLVYSSVVLQRHRSIRKGSDIRRILERRLGMWSAEDYDTLIQEAVRCDKSLVNRNKFSDSRSHITSIFTKLMLLGKVKAAVRWISEQATEKVLRHDDLIDEMSSGGDISRVPVIDILHRKHPEPSIPPQSILIECDPLPVFENVEITGNIIQRVASMIQGSAGPGGCDSNHWQDALLRYGAHSTTLRESVACLARTIANTILPWSETKCLMASRLVALDKCPDVRPIGIGETLRRLIGKAVVVITRRKYVEVISYVLEQHLV